MSQQISFETPWLFQLTDTPEAEFGWEEVALPHDWAAGKPFDSNSPQGTEQGFSACFGIGWYKTKFNATEKDLESALELVIEGAYSHVIALVNGKTALCQPVHYTEARAAINELALPGVNELAIRVENKEGWGERWYSGAGLFRNVIIESRNPSEIRKSDIIVKQAFFPGGKVELAVSVEDAKEIEAKVFYDGKELAQGSGRNVTLKLDNPPLWSAASPKLVKLLVSEVGSEDFVELAIGIRSVEFENDIGFIVNGKPEKLKGVCLHQDGGGVGVAVTKPLLRQRLEVFKSMGCNAIRTSHATPSVDFMDLCDELGFYVISEFTDKWSTGAYGHFFDERWESDLTFMVKRDRNRPSVVIWSVGNEVEAQGSEDMLKKLEALVGVARALDNRPVTCGLSPHYANFDASVAKGLDEVLGSIDRIAQKVDILGLNYQEPWLQLIRSRNPDKLAVATEAFIFFKGSTYNYFNYTTENPWLDVERNDFFIGSFLWAGADYLGESMGWPSKGWSSGIISRDSRRKPISWLFESYWSEKPSVHISVVDYTMPDDITREPWACPPMSDTLSFPKFRRMPLPYMIFTNCQKARLFAGNKEYEIKSPKEFEGRVITGYLPMDHEVVTVKGYNGGTEVASHSIFREGAATKLVLDQEYSDVLPGGQLQVNVLAVDENGHVNHRAEGEVFFEAEGGFLLESAFNGDMLSEYPLNSKSAKLFKGAASAIVRRKSGNARLLAKCEGLEPAVLYF